MTAHRIQQAARCLLALVLGLWLGTMVCAVQYKFHPHLGEPWRVQGLPVYAPWHLLQWWHWWGTAPVKVGLTVAGALFGLCLIPIWRIPPPDRRPSGTRLGTLRDLWKAGLLSTRGVVLGKYWGFTIRYNGPAHVGCVGPTRSGKGTAHVVPTLLDAEGEAGSIVVHDPKMELYRITGRWRATHSRVIYFAPTDRASMAYDPLRGIRIGHPEAIRDAQLVAQTLSNPDGKDLTHPTAQHFFLLTSQFLMALLLFCLDTRLATTLGGVRRTFYAFRWKDLLAEMRTSAVLAVQETAGLMRDIKGDELSSLRSTTNNALALWMDPFVEQCTNRADFCVDDLRDRVEPMTVYLSIPFRDQARLRPLTRLLTWQLLDYCLTRQTGWLHPVLFLLDEVATLKYMPMIPEGLEYVAGYGVRFAWITPSLTPLEDLYGTRNNFWEGTEVRLLFPPNSGRLADFYAHEAGVTPTEKTRVTKSQERGSPFGRRATSTEDTLEPLLSATQIQHLAPQQVLLLMGRKPPVLLTQARYYWYRPWKQRAMPL